LEKRLLNGQQDLEDIVVHGGDDLEATSLSAVDVSLLEKKSGALRHSDIENLEVLHLAEKSFERWVEVDTHESLLSNWSGLPIQKHLVQMHLSVILDSVVETDDLLLVVFANILDQ